MEKTPAWNSSPALKGVFSGLTRVQEASSSGEAQLVLTPRFVDIGATQKAFAFSDRELVVLVEWTVKDKSGKSVWIETVQGSAKKASYWQRVHSR